jgi:hypothetical protein
MTSPKAEPLIFPNGVRFLRQDECPPDQWEQIKTKLESANITTGYVRYPGKEAFAAQFEANTHAPNVFALFRDLVQNLLPDVAAPIIGLKDEDPVFGPYTDREAALAVFAPYIGKLQHDGFLEFGMIFAHEGKVDEIFVRSSKYLQIWTNRPEDAERIFERHRIPNVPDLQFIDNFPTTSWSVEDDKNTASWPGVFHPIEDAFKTLPQPGPVTTS